MTVDITLADYFIASARVIGSVTLLVALIFIFKPVDRPMTNEQLRKLLGQVTPGDWHAEYDEDTWETRIYAADGTLVACVGNTHSIETAPDRVDSDGDLMAMSKTLAEELIAVREALKSIADNTCCDGCGEAAKVARAALARSEGGE